LKTNSFLYLLKDKYKEINNFKVFFFKYNKAKGLRAGPYKTTKLYDLKRYTFPCYTPRVASEDSKEIIPLEVVNIT
jgi:hypothetical protein